MPFGNSLLLFWFLSEVALSWTGHFLPGRLCLTQSNHKRLEMRWDLFHQRMSPLTLEGFSISKPQAHGVAASHPGWPVAAAPPCSHRLMSGWGASAPPPALHAAPSWTTCQLCSKPFPSVGNPSTACQAHWAAAAKCSVKNTDENQQTWHFTPVRHILFFCTKHYIWMLRH